MRLIEDKEENSLRVVNAMRIKEEWNEFVFKHPYGNIFQSPHLAQVFEKAKGIEPIALALVDEKSGKIYASLLAFVMKYTNIFGSFTSRARIRGGPLFLDNEEGFLATKILLKYYEHVVRKKALYTDIWNLKDIRNLTASIPIRDGGYVYEAHLNFLIDLTKSKEELWANLSKKRRNNIRRALKNGVTVKVVESEDQIYKFYDMLHETYRNAKLPLADISLFRSIFKSLTPKNMAKLLLAKYENNYIGGILILTYDGVIYDWYAGADREYLKVCPNDLLTWHAIEWGSKNGYHTFDFGGAGNPNNNEHEGIREFKKQFGGQLVNFGRYKKIHSPRKLWLAEGGFEVWRKLKL